VSANQPAPIIVVKKVKGGHGHHGGAWKVAYADFVTAMMSLFMVLWLVSQTDQETKEQISEYFRTGMFSGSSGILTGSAYGIDGDREAMNPTPMDDGDADALKKAEMRAMAAIRRMREIDPKAKVLVDNVVVRMVDEGLLIEIIDGGNDMSFDLGSADLKPALAQLMAELAPALREMPNQLQLHGHTDARPFPPGSNRTNWSLSFERADAARQALISAGVAEKKIVGVYAHGDSQLLFPSEPENPANRRLSILAMRQGADANVKKALEIVRRAHERATARSKEGAGEGEPGTTAPAGSTTAPEQPAPSAPEAPHAPDAHGEAPHAAPGKEGAPAAPKDSHAAPSAGEH